MKPGEHNDGASGGLKAIQRWSIDHSLAVVAVLAAAVIGAIFMMDKVIPRRFAPYVQSPELGVVTMMPGLSARDMESYVSKPLEDELVDVPGVKNIHSTSQEGFSIVILEFPYGSNMQKAQADVQQSLNVAQGFLPQSNANLKPSFVIPVDPLNIPILTLAVTGDADKGWSMPAVRQFVDNQVVAKLRFVPNVYAVVPFGGFRRQLQVLVDRAKLSSYGISILDVRDAIDAANLRSSGGTLTEGSQESAVRVGQRLTGARDLKNIPIVARTAEGVKEPVTVRIKDVAKVVDTVWEQRSGYDYLDHPPGKAATSERAIEVSVVQNPGASSATVVPAVMQEIHQLERANPGLHFQVAYDNAHFVNILFGNVWEELLTAVLLSSVAVFFFLGQWRGALITMATVPTSLAIAILAMVPFGMTFNSGTLIGLLLGIGRLVDDTIIDVHSVERHLRMGKSPKEATIDGIGEVRVPVIASTLMIVLALIPLPFAGGLVGQMFVELVWPLIFSLMASMLVSFTLTAVLSSRLLHAHGAVGPDSPWVDRATAKITGPFQRLLDRIEHGYSKLLGGLLKNRFITVVCIIATITVGFTFYYFLGTEMMPLADTGQASATLEMQPGTSYAGTAAAVRQLEAIMGRYPELEKASIEIGSESLMESWNPVFTGYQMPEDNSASIMLTFSDKDSRTRTIFQIMDGIQREALNTIPGIRRLQIKEMGSDVMATAQAPININLYGPNLAELNHIGRKALAVAKKMPELFQPAKTWTYGRPTDEIKVDLVRAADVGLSPAAIADQAYYSLRGGLTSTFWQLPNLRENTILVRYQPGQHGTESDLEGTYLTGTTGEPVPLSSVATVIRTVEPTAIERDGLKRVIGITGFYRPGNLPSMDVVMNLISNIVAGNRKIGAKAVNFPNGYGLFVRGDMTQMMASVRRLTASFAIAIVLMYLVLVIQFGGFLQPLQMIASLPLELAGAFTALWLAHQAFSTVSFLGIIVLTGMDITTAVLLIDQIMRRRSHGEQRDTAVLLACPERLRPILMTSIITLVVMLSVAVAPKTGMDAYQPLAVAVVGGLTVGTALSLIGIPVMHTLVDDAMIWLRKVVRR